MNGGDGAFPCPFPLRIKKGKIKEIPNPRLQDTPSPQQLNPIPTDLSFPAVRLESRNPIAHSRFCFSLPKSRLRVYTIAYQGALPSTQEQRISTSRLLGTCGNTRRRIPDDTTYSTQNTKEGNQCLSPHPSGIISPLSRPVPPPLLRWRTSFFHRNPRFSRGFLRNVDSNPCHMMEALESGNLCCSAG